MRSGALTEVRLTFGFLALITVRLTFGFLALITVAAIVYWLATEMWGAVLVGLLTLCFVGMIYAFLEVRMRRLDRMLSSLEQEVRERLDGDH